MDRLALLEKMIAGGSKDPFHHYARAMELRAAGRLEEALEAYSSVGRSYPSYVPTYLMAAQVSAELGLVEETRNWLASGIEAAKEAGDDHALSELKQAETTLLVQ